IIGEFRLAAFGPTEFKAILALFGPVAAVLHSVRPDLVTQAALLFLAALIAVGLTGLIFQTISAVREVNRSGAAPDATPWRPRSRRNRCTGTTSSLNSFGRRDSTWKSPKSRLHAPL